MPMDTTSLPPASQFSFIWDTGSGPGLLLTWWPGEVLQITISIATAQPTQVQALYTEHPLLRETKRHRPVPSLPNQIIPQCT